MKNGVIIFGIGAIVVIGCAGSGGGGGNGAERADCIRNLSRLSTALNAYANDYDDVLPSATWTDALPPYIAVTTASFTCPSLPVGSFGYAYNSALPGHALNSISDLDTTPVFFDSIVLAADTVDAPTSAAPQRHGGRNTVYLSGRLDPDDIGGGTLPPPPELRNVCISRLRIVGSAFNIYASDYDDQLPPSNWTDALTTYVSADVFFHCPSVPTGNYGYAMNNALLGTATTAVSAPNTTPLAFDSSNLARNATSTYLLANPPRHSGNNVAFVDGHASEAP